MIRKGEADPQGVAIRTGRVIRVACAILAILSAALLVAPGLYILGISALLGVFHDVTGRIRSGPPTPLELANDARNAADLTAMYRQSIAMIGLGAVVILTCLVVARRTDPGRVARRVLRGIGRSRR